MKRSVGWMGAIVLAVALPVGLANAATVTMALDNDDPLGPNTWLVTAKASVGDNDGFAAVGVVLLNTVTIANELPLHTDFDGANVQAVGFDLLRSAAGANPITGAQDTITDFEPLAFGVGQVAAALPVQAAHGIVHLSSVNDPYAFPLLVATGTWDGITKVEFDLESVDMFVNVFTSGSVVGTVGQHPVFKADLVLIKVPEPATLALMSLGGLMMLQRRRLA